MPQALEELRGKLRRAEDWLAEARRNQDSEAIAAWSAKVAELKAEIEQQGR